MSDSPQGAWERLQQIFREAIELTDEDRERYLEETCGGDKKLLAQVRQLVEAHDSSAQTLESEGPDSSLGTLVEGEFITDDSVGSFKIIQEIGEGGFGIVYLAEQTKPVKRRVAIKVIKPGMDSKAVIARFEAERQALAMMDHPGIARVFEAGETGQGRPFFIMEFVKGESLTTYCDKSQLDTDARLALIAKVCDAVQHAHQKGIIHRDLKPANILVTIDQQDEPQPKVIDFGIAKATSQQLTERTLFTAYGQLIGTPEYMSPEQAEMSITDIDTRSDVYSLGVILYELLTGRLPFDRETLREAGFAEIQRIIREDDPPKPSTRLSTLAQDEGAQIATARQTKLADLTGTLRRELEWIPLKALRKNRTERYDSAKSLGDDVRRYLDGEPLEAGPESATYRARKFVRRHKGPVIAAILVLLVLVAGIVSTTIFAVHAGTQARLAEKRAEEATAVTNFLKSMLTSVDPYQSKRPAYTIQEALAKALDQLEDEEGRFPPEAKAMLLYLPGETFRALAEYDRAEGLMAEALKIQVEVHGEESLPVARAKWGLAQLLSELSRDRESLAYAEEALASRRKLGGDEESDILAVAGSLEQVGMILGKLGRFQEARASLTEALEITRAAKGDGYETVHVLNELSQIAQAQGDMAQCTALIDEALEICERELPAGDLKVTDFLNNRAFLWLEEGRTDQAGPLIERVLEIRRAVLPANHPKIASALLTYADYIKLSGRTADAVPIYEEILTIDQETFGTGHPYVAMDLDSLAAALADAGRPHEAIEKLRDALAIYERHPDRGPDHLETLAAVNNLAEVLYRINELDDAEDLYTRSTETYARLGHDKNPGALTASRDLARTYDRQGRLDEAETLYRWVLEMQQEVHGRDNDVTLTTENDLANLHVKQERYDEALALHQRMLEIRTQMLGPKAKNTVSSMQNVGWVHLKRGTPGDYEKAEAIFTEALALRREIHGNSHTRTITTLINLSLAKENQGRGEDAATDLQGQLEMMQSDPNATLLHEMRVARALGVLLMRMERFEESEALLLEKYRKALETEGEESNLTIGMGKVLAELYEAQGRPEDARKYLSQE